MQCTVIESNIQSCAVLYSDRLLQYIIVLYNNVNYLVELSPPPARQTASWEVVVGCSHFLVYTHIGAKLGPRELKCIREKVEFPVKTANFHEIN